MSDIDRIISGVGGNTRYDFSTFGDPVKSYMDAQDRKAKNELRDAFKGGVPTLPDGSIDYGTMQKTLYQKGAVEQGNALMGAGVREVEGRMMDSLDGRAQPQAIVSPPSANRSASAVVAPPLNKGGVAQPGRSSQGDQPGSIVGLVSSAGIPDELAGPVIAQVSAMSKTDPNTALSPDMAPRIQQVVQAAAQRMKTGQAPQPTGIQPQQAPPQALPVMAQAQPQAQPQAAPEGFQPPPNVVAAQNDPILKRLSFLARSQDKSTAEAARIRLKDYLERTMPTQDQKNATGSGMSLPDYQSQGDERAAQLAILKDTVLPELKVSKEGASAARSEIQSLHKAREQLDSPGGIFTGTGAQIKLKLAKAAELVGVPNADKITNTEAFGTAIGGRVLASLKALGVNPSNKDLVFAEKMSGGNIELNESSIRRIIDIGEQAARDKIDRHNTTSGQFIETNEAMKPYAKVMRVDAPGQYQRPKGQPVGTPSTFSSPSDVHAAIAAGKLKKGDTFQDSNGKTRVVP